MHIPPHLILPQDQVDLTDLGPPDPDEPPNGDAENLAWKVRKAERDAFVAGGSRPQVMRMHVVDAKHAMDVEPDRYVLPVAPPTPEPSADVLAQMAADPEPEAEEIHEDSDRE